MKRRLIMAGLVVVTLLGVVVTRAVWEGHRALVRGEAALAEGKMVDAIEGFRRAARWYLPLAPHVTAAYDRLGEIAKRAEEAGDRETALEAWGAIRGSLLATRSLYTPMDERQAAADRAIARLRAEIEIARRVAPRGPSRADIEAWHLQLLARDASPSIGWTLLALLGLASWVGGGVLFAWSGVGAEDRLVARPAVTSAVLIVAGLLMWAIGLFLA